MSQTTAVRTAPRPVGRSAPRPGSTAPRLRVVSAPAHTRSRAGLVFGCMTLLGSGLVVLLLLNVGLERGSYVLQDQQAKATQLQDQAQSLREQLATLRAPQNLAARATKLGMVPNPNAAFLRASDGKVLGVPTRAGSTKALTVTQSPGVKAGSTKPGSLAASGGTAKGSRAVAAKPAVGAKKPAPTPTH
jgi:hypothetical protein